MNEENNELIKTEVIETTPEDGLVHEREVSQLGKYGEHHYGYQTRTVTTISDPRIVKKFLYVFSGIFILIGVILCFFSLIVGLIFAGIGVYFLVTQLKVVNSRQKELEAQGHDFSNDDNVDEQIKAQFKHSGEQIKKSFTKDKYKWFVKMSLPFTIIVLLIISIMFGFMFTNIEGFSVGIAIGSATFIIGGLFMVFFYWIVSKFFH